MQWEQTVFVSTGNIFDGRCDGDSRLFSIEINHTIPCYILIVGAKRARIFGWKIGLSLNFGTRGGGLGRTRSLLSILAEGGMV